MTDKRLTWIVFLLDRSGSMTTIARDIEGGFTSFIDEQKKGEGKCLVTLAQFDNEYQLVYEDTPVKKAPPLSLSPRGSTALHDAMGRLITSTREKYKALDKSKRPGAVIFAVMTDGYENASKEWNAASVKDLVSKTTSRYGWQFLYMGADQDAIEEGAKIGIPLANSLTCSRGNMEHVLRNTASNISLYRESVAAGDVMASVSYTSAQRAEAIH